MQTLGIRLTPINQITEETRIANRAFHTFSDALLASRPECFGTEVKEAFRAAISQAIAESVELGETRAENSHDTWVIDKSVLFSPQDIMLMGDEALPDGVEMPVYEQYATPGISTR